MMLGKTGLWAVSALLLLASAAVPTLAQVAYVEPVDCEVVATYENETVKLCPYHEPAPVRKLDTVHRSLAATVGPFGSTNNLQEWGISTIINPLRAALYGQTFRTPAGFNIVLQKWSFFLRKLNGANGRFINGNAELYEFQPDLPLGLTGTLVGTPIAQKSFVTLSGAPSATFSQLEIDFTTLPNPILLEPAKDYILVFRALGNGGAGVLTAGYSFGSPGNNAYTDGTGRFSTAWVPFLTLAIPPVPIDFNFQAVFALPPAPTVIVPLDFTVEATGPNPNAASVPFIANATDALGGALTTTCTIPLNTPITSPVSLPLGPTTVTCSATDAGGQTSTASFVITVVDTTPPSFTVSNVIAEGFTSPSSPIPYPLPVPVDLVDPNPTIVCVPPPNSFFPIGVSIVTCTATDVSGNSFAQNFTLTVVQTLNAINTTVNEILIIANSINQTVTVINAGVTQTIQLISNSTALLHAKLNNITTTVNNINTTVNTIDAKVDNITTTVNNINTTVNTIDAKVDNITTTVDNINTTVNTIDAKVDNINTTVNTIDAKANNITTTVNNINTTVNTIDAKVDNITTTVNNINTTVNNINTTVNNINTTVNALNTRLGCLNAMADIFKTTPGLGCNGFDDNCNGQVDECLEDQYKPFFVNPDCQPALSGRWVSTPAQAKQVLCDNLKPRDDCTTDQDLNITATQVPGTSCANAQWTVTATDKCLNTQTRTLSLPYYPSTGGLNLTLGADTVNFAQKSFFLTDIGFKINATDPACPGAKLAIKLTVWSDEGYAPTYDKPNWRDTFAQVVPQIDGNNALTGYGVWLLPLAFKAPCDPKFKILCSTTSGGGYSRNYFIDVTITNPAGVSLTKTLPVSVKYAFRRMTANSVDAVTGNTKADRALHPGTAAANQRFKLVEVEGVLGA